jgi:hypothetical protein
MMPRKIRLDGLQAEAAEVNHLLLQAIENADPIGQLQYAKRKTILENEITYYSENFEKSASVALFFGGDPVMGSRGIAADFAGNILDQFQEIIAKTFAQAELGILGKRGPVPLQQATQLMITEVARGSFGFILDEFSNQLELEETSLKKITETAVVLLQRTASANDQDFDMAVSSLDGRLLIALKSFFTTLDSKNATIRVVEDLLDFTLDHEAIKRARQRTESTLIDEGEFTCNGILEGFLPEHRKFELKTSEGVIYGSVSKGAVEQYKNNLKSEGSLMNKQCRIVIEKRTISPLNRPAREVNRLIRFVAEAQI